MKVTLEKKDYQAITGIVRSKLKNLLPDNELLNNGDIIFGPEFMAAPLRVSTPSTRFEFSKEQREYVSLMRKEINESAATRDEKKRKLRNLESIILFGQILFAQSASLHFLTNHQYKHSANNTTEEAERANIAQQMQELQKLVEKEGIQYSSSKFEALSRRKEFNDKYGALKHVIKEANLHEEDKYALLNDLSKAKSFHYQANDFNFKYANKPSRSYSNFLKDYEFYGSKIALAASMIAIGATALSLIPPLAPIMGPIAIVASTISLVIGMPLAFKNLGTMIYNLIKFGAEPTPGEIINAAVLGVGNIVGQAVTAGVTGQNATTIMQGVTTGINAGKIALGLKGQVEGLSSQAKVSLYKSELDKLKVADEQPSPPTGPQVL